MKVFNGIIASACLAAFSLAALPSRAADLQLLPGASVRLGFGANASSSQRIAVDVSSNVVNWVQMTNVAPVAGQVTFANDPSQSDPMRFFRFADGDDTFAIAGIVDGGQYLGGLAGVTVTESATGVSVKTDASGLFHFDHRFFRTNLPITLNASADGLQTIQRRITAADAGAFSVLQSLASQIQIDPADTTFHFNVTGGPRAGLEYTMRFYDSWFEITGGMTGRGIFMRGNSSISLTNPATGTSVLNYSSFWSGGTNASGLYGWFSGIPSTNGILSGNGTFTTERTVVAPPSLNGLAFSIGTGEIQFTNSQFTLKWDGSITTGSYSASPHGNFWDLQLYANGTYRISYLYFLTAANGSFLLETTSGLVVTGDMQQIPFTPPPTDGVLAPMTPPTINITTMQSGIGQGVQYTVIFSGGPSGVFSITNTGGFGSGTYTYTADGTSAHLHMIYNEFPGDYDDMILTFKGSAGSGAQNPFTGTQQVSGSIYTFTGTFTY